MLSDVVRGYQKLSDVAKNKEVNHKNATSDNLRYHQITSDNV